MLAVLKQQYQFIKSTRQTLFSFLEDIPLQELQNTIPNFGSGSIIKTHFHVADCYIHWLGSFALKRSDIAYATDDEIKESNVKQVRDRFEFADELVNRFMDEYDTRWFENVVNQWHGEPLSATPLWLLTHTETHEFHHKGQIVSMARHLGYTPPDTDLVL